MAYNGDITWTDVAGELSYYGNRAKDAILAGHERYQEWVSFRNGRSDAEVATALSVDVSAIVDAEYAFSALEEIYMAADNGVVIQANRLGALRKFT